MRRQFLLASVGAIALAGSAFAADLPMQAPPPPVPIFSWTGLYLGGQIGYAWDHDNISSFFPLLNINNSLSDSPSGVIGGAHIGYNLQINQWVAGVEGTVDGTSVQNTVLAAFPVPTVSYTTRASIQGSLRARAGVAWDRALIYVTGGAAFTGITNNYFAGFPLLLSDNISKTRSGWTVGGGIEYAVTNNWSVRAEYRYSDFGHFTDFPFVTVAGAPFVQHHLTQNQVQMGVSYKFDSLVPAPVVARY
jgi:outer membrane immunogenic protein